MITRRQLLRVLGGAAALARVGALGCGSSSTPPPAGDALFTADELAMLRGFADAVLPADELPGGADLGAVAYIEQLLTAFSGAVPAIYADGPFSSRSGAPTSDFARWVELDRVSAAAWRLQIADLDAQLRAALAAALAQSPDVHALAPDDFALLFDAQPDAAKQLFIDLVTEAAFAAPEYGGNPNLAGWQLCHFEGDSLPRGYSQWDGAQHVERPESPLSTANPGPDPDPLSPDVKDVLSLVVTVLGGRAL